VLNEYKSFAPPAGRKVMAHYWNPTNFNNRDDLVVPLEISDPEVYPHPFENID
jgi:hypothetical protein